MTPSFPSVITRLRSAFTASRLCVTISSVVPNSLILRRRSIIPFALIVSQVLKIVGLEEKKKRYPYQLSGGEQQRVAIARALVHRPKLLIADEPTGNLDAINAKGIIDLLLKINEFGTTLLMVTHNREAVNALRKRVITLGKDGVISDQTHGKYFI